MLGAYLRKEERVLLAWAGCSLAYGDLERFSGIGSSGALPIIIVGTRDAPASEAVSDLRFMGLSVASVDDPNRELPFGLPAIVQVDGASGKITVHQGVDGIMIQAVAGREALGEPNTPSLESWPGRPSFQLYTN